jgi:carbon storage regulator CsrA
LLCITRKLGEGVFIGRGIRITVLETYSQNGSIIVKLGIEAPKNVAVSRDDFTIEQHLAAQIRREVEPIHE